MTDEDSVGSTTTVKMGQSESMLLAPPAPTEEAEEVLEGNEEGEVEESGTASDPSSDGRTLSSASNINKPASASGSAHSGVLEWNFIDFTKAERCPIYDVDPVMLKKFIGHNVTVVNSSQERFHGCCLAIDPISLSVILARRTPDAKIRITTLPGYHLKRIFVDPNSVPKEYSVSVNDLDITELYHAGSLFRDKKDKKAGVDADKLSSQVPPAPTSSNNNASDANANSPSNTAAPDELSAEDIQKRKELLKGLLAKNLMPCTEKGEVLELPGGMRILPPYTTESCDTKGNKLIQRKLGELIETIHGTTKKPGGSD